MNPALLAPDGLEDGLYIFQTDASLDESDPLDGREQIQLFLIGHLVLVSIFSRNDHFLSLLHRLFLRILSSPLS